MDDAKYRGCLVHYKYADLTKRELYNVVQCWKSLSASTDKFIFNDGSCKDLINLEGTIPVIYKSVTYNIPVCIWLMDTHPDNAPLCFVKPTSDMSIKVSKYVDNNGKIYLPFLHNWNGKNSNLISLVRNMITAFGELPPVYSKPQMQKQPPYPTTSFMPQPGGTVPNFNLPYPTQPYPQPSIPNFYPPNPYQPYAAANPFQYPPGGYQPQSQNTITEEHIRASLYSAVEDKLRRRMHEQFLQNQAELDTLRRTQQELTEGRVQLDDILGRLEKEKVELDKNITILKDKEQELENSIEKLSEQESIDPDDAVTTTTPLYNQLFNAFAEEATTEDAIYYMGEALRAGVIDLDAFLKQVRALSRKQFALRALMQKCRQKAGLAC
ncbi:tumor susceptibility gene 101 [Arctopsyche grandis]|uniref:tumor susceptibility gene 101 n=1 Tax=Arctopsyche grandis TaxID=121162 RepID=UPI00406D70E3